MPVCNGLILAHGDYETEACRLYAFRIADGMACSMLLVVTGLTTKALQRHMADHRATHVCLIGNVDEVADCEGDVRLSEDASQPDVALTPYIGRIDSGVQTASLDARRANVRKQIDKIIAHDRPEQGATPIPTRYIGVAADETKSELPLLTGCHVMAHVLEMVDTMDERTQVLISDGTRTWNRRDTTETPVDATSITSLMASSDYLFLVGAAEADRIQVPTADGPIVILSASTPWPADASHPIVFAFVSGRSVASLTASLVACPTGPCAWCVFAATDADDQIQAVYTMWGILRLLREMPDARLGDVVYGALACTKRQMDIDCIVWTLRGDPCTRLGRRTRLASTVVGPFDAVPNGSTWCLLDPDGRPLGGVGPLECTLECTSDHTWSLSVHHDRTTVEYNATSGIRIADVADDASTTIVTVDYCRVSSATIRSCLRHTTSLCVDNRSSTPELQMHLTNGERLRWTRLYTGKVDGASVRICVDHVPYRLTNLAPEWYERHHAHVVRWIHTTDHADVQRDASTDVVVARVLAWSVVSHRVTFDTVDRYVPSAEVARYTTSVSLVVHLPRPLDAEETDQVERTVRQRLVDDLHPSASPSVALVASPMGGVGGGGGGGTAAQQLYIVTSWVDATSGSFLHRLVADPSPTWGLTIPTVLSDLAVTHAYTDPTMDDGSNVGSVDDASVNTVGRAAEAADLRYAVVNLRIKANYPLLTLFPDGDSVQAWMHRTVSALASCANVRPSRLQLSIVLATHPYTCVLQIHMQNDGAWARSLPMLEQILAHDLIVLPMGATYEVREVNLRQSRERSVVEPLTSDVTAYRYTAPADVLLPIHVLLAPLHTWVTTLAERMHISPVQVDLQVTVSFDTGQMQLQIGTRDGACPSRLDSGIAVHTMLHLPSSVVCTSQTTLPAGTFPWLTAHLPSDHGDDIIINDEIVPSNVWCMCAIVDASFTRYIDRIQAIQLQNPDGRFTLITERNPSILSTLLVGAVVWIFLV